MKKPWWPSLYTHGAINSLIFAMLFTFWGLGALQSNHSYVGPLTIAGFFCLAALTFALLDHLKRPKKC